MLKRVARSIIAGCCRFSGFVASAEAQQIQRLTILTYHRILPLEAKLRYFLPDLVVTPIAFETHCRVLAKNYQVLPISEAVQGFLKNETSDKPLAAITFDDGYRDNVRYGLPILEKTGLSGTFFIISDLVGKEQIPWYDQLGRALYVLHSSSRWAEAVASIPDMNFQNFQKSVKQYELQAPRTPAGWVTWAKRLGQEERRQWVEEFWKLAGLRESDIDPDDRIMSADEVKKLAACGHEIGSHSATHPILSTLSDDELRREVQGSRTTLESLIGERVRSFCYPNGDHDDRVRRFTAEAEYKCAVTVAQGGNERMADLFALRRWFIHEDRLAGFGGAPSATLFRMEISGLAERVFRRQGLKSNSG